MPSKKAHSKHFSRTSRLYMELQKNLQKFLQGVGAPQMFLAPGLALPKTATGFVDARIFAEGRLCIFLNLAIHQQRQLESGSKQGDFRAPEERSSHHLYLTAQIRIDLLTRFHPDRYMHPLAQRNFHN